MRSSKPVRVLTWVAPVSARLNRRLFRSALATLVVAALPGRSCPAGSPAAVAPQKAANPSAHWAFQTPVRPPLPKVQAERWCRNPVDRFVLARLERQHLHPSPEADRVTLIRRLSLDLTGLPPTIAAVDEFVADRSVDAYEKLVEGLLTSPHYGECWGRHWLDAARYADTNGYEKDLPRSIWPYRDWVINAFNRNLPFDRFTVEQLAGDLLPDATLEQRVATGFLRNSMLNEEGGVDPEQFRIEGLIDRVDAIGKAFLGLTINCAQCHNHKYDPITQKEYYRFLAFLNNDDEPEVEVPTPEQAGRRREILAKIEGIEDDLMARNPDWLDQEAAWEREAQRQPGHWTVLDPDSWFASNGTKFEKQPDGSLLATASNPGDSAYTVTAKTSLTHITAFRLEALTDPNLPRSGPGRSRNGNFVLSEFTVNATPRDQPPTTNSVPWQTATADFSQPEFPVTNAIDGNPKTGWAIDAGPGRVNQDRKAVFETKTNVGFDGGAVLTFTLLQKHGDQLALGRFRLSATTDPRPVVADPVPNKVRAILAIPPDRRTREQHRALFSLFRTTVPAFAKANREIDDLMKDWPVGPTTLALAQRKQPRQTHIFTRGDWRRPGELVTPGVPAVLSPLPPGAPLNRLTLAKWIADRRNPLTARVVVNRIWQAYFGQGLVTTPEDFGTRCDPSSHPDLLDWLACEFMERGWDVKAIHRLIVRSATYRQSSKVVPALYAVDQYNRWLERGPRFRVDAEIVHDVALAASGLLSPKIGGPSVYPPIPDGVLSLGYGSPMPWPTSTGEDRFRRGLYTFWKRTVPYPSLLVFDMPNADFACVRRVRSNTPLQALTTLNDTVFEEAAQALALRTYKDGGPTDRDRAVFAFRLCTSRRPDSTELRKMLALLRDQEKYFANRTAAAVFVSAPDLKNPPPDVNLHRVAAWTVVARVLLNLDETMTKE